MEASLEALTLQSMRPDIQQAKTSPAEIKSKLVFRDVDELDTGMQKVQPLPFLDEEIHKHFDVIKKSVQPAKQVNDGLPEKVFQKVDTVIKEADAGKTTLFKASDLLELTSEAYLYARGACLDNFDLERKAQQELRKYDDVFRRMIGDRIEARMEEAGADLDECRSLLDEAVSLAEHDRDRQRDRAEKENSDLSDDFLRDTHTSTQESIRDEKGELEMIRDQCVTDIGTLDSELVKFHGVMDQAARDYQQHEQKQENDLTANRYRQRQLEEELAQLKREEQKLENDLRKGRELQDEASVAREVARKEVSEWKEKIEELQRRTATALSVMHHMEECTDMIMDNAKERKRDWKTRLSQLELESLLSLRDSLMAQGGLYLMISTESKGNSEEITRELQRLVKEKMTAAKTGFAMRVNELNDRIKGYTEQKTKFQEKLEEMNALLAGVRDKVKEVDGKIKQLRPSVKLDNLDDRYQQRKRTMDQAFKKMTVDTIQFNSMGNYN